MGRGYKIWGVSIRGGGVVIRDGACLYRIEISYASAKEYKM